VRWYLIHTKSGREAAAESNLVRQGYQVYYPRLSKPTRLGGRWVTQAVSLFPRYLFLRLAVGHQAIGPVRSTVGVSSIVRFGHSYAVVPDGVVEDLRVRSDPATGLHNLTAHLTLKPGSGVRIVTGPFEGLEGVFRRECGEERVVLLLGLLGRETSVELPAAFVVPQRNSSERLPAR
jgi:transcriptional antiterminator RfaH